MTKWLVWSRVVRQTEYLMIMSIMLITIIMVSKIRRKVNWKRIAKRILSAAITKQVRVMSAIMMLIVVIENRTVRIFYQTVVVMIITIVIMMTTTKIWSTSMLTFTCHKLRKDRILLNRISSLQNLIDEYYQVEMANSAAHLCKRKRTQHSTPRCKSYRTGTIIWAYLIVSWPRQAIKTKVVVCWKQI